MILTFCTFHSFSVNSILFLYEAKCTIRGRGFAFGPFFFPSRFNLLSIIIQLKVELYIQGFGNLRQNFFSVILFISFFCCSVNPNILSSTIL